MRLRTLLLSLTALTLVNGCSTDNGSGEIRLEGGSTLVKGSRVATFATTDALGNVKEVGFTMDADLVTDPPTEPGDGPLGAVAVLPYPQAVRDQTLFNHFEMHWNVMGHEPGMYELPHFDFHFYGIPVAEVAAIAPPDSEAPVADRVPAGYMYPGVQAAVPQMGVHAAPMTDMEEGFVFEKTMILGYWGGSLIFVEPMITKAFLEQKESFVMEVAVPNELGQTTRYPTRMHGTYDSGSDTWTFAFTDFVSKD